MTRSQYATNWVNEDDIIMADPGTLATLTISEEANAVIAEDGSLQVSAENPNNRTTEISKVMDIIPANKQFSLKTHIKNSGQNPIFISVVQLGEQNQLNTLASRMVTVEADIDLISTSKSNTNPLKVIISTQGNTQVNVNDIHLTRRDVLESVVTDYICSVDEDFGDDYRFGFNGQHKENEVAGIGNHNTALFWEYDSRLGRRWNVDPKPNPSISYYVSFANNSISFTDPLGDTVLRHNANNKGVYIIPRKFWNDETGALKKSFMNALKSDMSIIMVDDLKEAAKDFQEMNGKFENVVIDNHGPIGDNVAVLRIGNQEYSAKELNNSKELKIMSQYLTKDANMTFLSCFSGNRGTTYRYEKNEEKRLTKNDGTVPMKAISNTMGGINVFASEGLVKVHPFDGSVIGSASGRGTTYFNLAKRGQGSWIQVTGNKVIELKPLQIGLNKDGAPVYKPKIFGYN